MEIIQRQGTVLLSHRRGYSFPQNVETKLITRLKATDHFPPEIRDIYLLQFPIWFVVLFWYLEMSSHLLQGAHGEP